MVNHLKPMLTRILRVTLLSYITASSKIMKNYVNYLSNSRGYVFNSQTDTEVIAHLVEWEMRTAATLLEAVQKGERSLRYRFEN